MTVLVTGATGFVGKHLVTRLVSQGYRVRALVRPTSRVEDIASLPVEIVTADLQRDAALDETVRDCGLVVHLAAMHGPLAPAEECERTNVQGTKRLAEAAARAGVSRFVNASTRGVYGMVRDATIDETTPTSPDTPYRRTKLRAEETLAGMAASHDLHYVNLRLPSMIGRGGMGWLGLYRAVARGNFRIIGSGRNVQHPCPVEDAVSAIVASASAPGADNETFVFSGAETVTIAEFIAMIASALGVRVSRQRLPLLPYRVLHTVHSAAARLRGNPAPALRTEFFTMSYRIDNRKASRLLGYSPTTSLSSAVQSLADWYRERGLVAV